MSDLPNAEMLIVDSHTHTGLNWGEPIEALLYHMEANGVSHAVLVGHNGNFDNSYMLDCMNRHPGRFAVVAILDPDDPKKSQTLEGLKGGGASGFRLNLRKPQERSGDRTHFRTAGELGMIVSVIGTAENFASAEFQQLLDDCPNTHFCLEHLARSPGADVVKAPYDIYEAALECAKWPNTTLKVPGQGEIAGKPPRLPKGYPYDEYVPHYAMALEAFGAKRMMWGSNYPPCSAKEGYRNTLQGVLHSPAFAERDDLERIMGKTAAKLWGFDA